MHTLTRTWQGGVPGFCEGLPNGAYIFNLPGIGVDTHQGRRPLPGANTSASYCRIAPDGVGIICQGQEDDTAWRWESATKWKSLGLPAFGPNATIFDALGLPVVNTGPPPVGYRYVAAGGAIVTCEATYADPARGLYEFTEFHDVAIGQGGDDIGEGAVVRFADDGLLRRFATGPIRNIRVRRSSDQFAVAMCDYGTSTATITWLTLAELRALPVVTPIDPPVEPPIEPPVEPPMPTDPPGVDFDLKPQVEAARAKYPHPLTADQPALILNEVAFEENLRLGVAVWGLSVKPSGNHVTSPQGVWVAYDILHYRPSNRLFDCLTGDLEGVVTWGESAYHNDPNRPWLAPVPVDEPTQPPQPPGTLPPGVYPITYPPGYVPPKDLNDWINNEFPVLVQAHIKTQGFAPDYTWAAFQTCRRYGAGLPQGEPAWTFEKMLKHELGQS
jgi:hypothetical protein